VAKISILLIDDHKLVLDLLKQNLELTGDFSVVLASSFEDGKQELIKGGNYHIVMLDILFLQTLSLQDVKSVVKMIPNGHCVIFSGCAKETFVQNCMDIGVSGYIPKTFSIDAVASALKFIATGQKFVPAEFLRYEGNIAGNDHYGIVAGEFAVLKKLAEGLSNKDITSILNIPESTVKMRVRSICQKLGAENRTHAVLLAQKNGLV
jgi:DNA-binding NarL/FixJ family response regulator